MLNYGLLGLKLGHSYSAQIHNYIFNKMSISAEYKLYESDNLALFVEFARKNLAGFNVTIPYKEKIMPFLDEIDEEALKLGNVNTVLVKEGKLYGYNTDGIGFISSLAYFNISYQNKNIYILGTGGASKTCYNMLVSKAKEIKLVSRTKTGANIISYEDLASKDIDLLINATPVGMYPNVLDCPVSLEVLNKTKEVFDLIYNPRQTKLLAIKKSWHNGLIMLIIQALAALKIWLNIDYDAKLIKEVGGIFE